MKILLLLAFEATSFRREGSFWGPSREGFVQRRFGTPNAYNCFPPAAAQLATGSRYR